MSTKVSTQMVRETFLRYFEKNGHRRVNSSSLIPENDPTLLFTNAGMNQFKNLFLGHEKRDYVRAASSQKCVRAGGKHNDLENVGFTARHHTFFEMLGNFSFGDYFKKEAIHFAWELLTKEFAIPKDKLYVTVFETDDEAAEIWHKQEGIPKDRIFRFGEKDNFWRMGETGPCGPCTEIFFDHGPRAGKESDPYRGILAGEDRFVEIWNLVFMQFFESAPGKLQPLPKPSVDTGSGLERLSAALQGRLNNYNTDAFAPMIEALCKWSKREDLLQLAEEGEKLGVAARFSPEQNLDLASLRVVSDHTRAVTFLLNDGALPSNEGRGYVLRRILRRGVRYCQRLSGQSRMADLAGILITQMKDHYPELEQRQSLILSTIKEEEERFSQTLHAGTEMLQSQLLDLKKKGKATVPGDVLFRLYDTYGFPTDLTRVMALEQGFDVDEADFQRHMTQAQEKAKASWKGKSLSADATLATVIAQKLTDENRKVDFTGYEGLKDQGKVLLIANSSGVASSLSPGEEGIIVTHRTPFYAEGGGQVGDQGVVTGSNLRARVRHTSAAQKFVLHHVAMEYGELQTGDIVTLQVHENERRATACNHSATHLLHAALRKVLGPHVTQAGSLVDSHKTRFDFTHSKPLDLAQITEIEKLVNDQIALAQPVRIQHLSYDEAIKEGAMALFGEKYGAEVRVLSMGEFSMELCGGTHVANTSEIRLFKVVAESGVSAGVRRIEAITGASALEFLLRHHRENAAARSEIGVTESWTQFLSSEPQHPVVDWIHQSRTQARELERNLQKAKSQSIDVDALIARARNLPDSSTKFLGAIVALDDREVLSRLADQLRDKLGNAVVVIAGTALSGPHPLLVSVSKSISDAFPAGKVLKEVSKDIGGKGGGKPEFAQGSFTDSGGFEKAVESVFQTLKSGLNGR